MKYIIVRKNILAVISIAILLAGCASVKPSENTNSPERTSEETIEVGYGEMKRTHLTGSVSVVDAEEIVKEQPSKNIADLLRGRAAGVIVSETPGKGIQVRIRGSRSLYGNNEPLYVIDGIPVAPDPDGSLSFINPYDIESISVLKDAAATAVYGFRGANGVILITTKRGGQ